MKSQIQDITNQINSIPNVSISIDNEANIISFKENNQLISEINITYSSERTLYYSFIINDIIYNKWNLKPYVTIKKRFIS